jgi:hypothetical protein
VLQWARAEGYRWSAEVTTAAKAHGYQHILKWARDNGCPTI